MPDVIDLPALFPCNRGRRSLRKTEKIRLGEFIRRDGKARRKFLAICCGGRSTAEVMERLAKDPYFRCAYWAGVGLKSLRQTHRCPGKWGGKRPASKFKN